MNNKIKLVQIGPFLDFFLRLLKFFNYQFLIKIRMSCFQKPNYIKRLAKKWLISSCGPRNRYGKIFHDIKKNRRKKFSEVINGFKMN